MRPSFNSVSVLAAVTSAIARATGFHDLTCGNEPSADTVLRMQAEFTEKRAAASRIEALDARAVNAIPLTIDVYFHVIFDKKDGIVTDDKLNSQINILNTDFASALLTFKIAKITRTENSDWFKIERTDDSQKQMKATLRNGGPGDLNVYLVGFITGNYGYSTFPNDYKTDPQQDGVVIRSTTLPGGTEKGRNDGRILTHEVGHWVGLHHIFENGCSGDDQVGDTPQIADKIQGCPDQVTTCSGSDTRVVHNFMGLSSCMSEFTDGQIVRMRDQIDAFRGLSTKVFSSHKIL